MAKRKRRGSSKAGRPRKDGERYANGRLKPPGPNATMIAKRKAGDAEAGEHPMDFALSQKWITEQQHRDVMAYRAAFNNTHIGGPKLSCGSLPEVPTEDIPPLEVLMRNLSQIPDADIAAAWDKFFGEAEAPPKVDDPEALGRWQMLNSGLSGGERQQLFMVAIMGSWPFWMPKAAAGKALGRQDEDRRAALFSAIGGVGAAMRPPKRKDTIAPIQYRRPRRAATEVPVRYETDFGEEVRPTSMHGRPFEVTTVQRRRP